MNIVDFLHPLPMPLSIAIMFTLAILAGNLFLKTWHGLALGAMDTSLSRHKQKIHRPDGWYRFLTCAASNGHNILPGVKIPCGLWIMGRTAIGRAAVEVLQLNRLELQNLRHILRAAGEHPPVGHQ